MDANRQEMHWLSWMCCRIPVRDALVAVVPRGEEERFKPPRPVYETRWFPRRDDSRVLIPYDGGPFDASTFERVKDGWDHVTCHACNARIRAMTRCYATREGAFLVLCGHCYRRDVVRMLPLSRSLAWRLKRVLGRNAAA